MVKKANIGNNTVTATKIYDNGVASVNNLVVHIDNTTSLTFGPLPDICNGAPGINLNSYVSPTGGSFSGPGVAGTTFTPSSGGVGTHTLTYTFTNGDGCTS